MIRIVADDKIPFLKGVLEPFAEVVYLPGRQINRAILKTTDALLIRTRTKCTESLLKGTNVRFIGTATIGFDHIDTRYCERHRIMWTNAPGCNSSSVQQYISAALLKLAHDKKLQLKDKTLGIIGVGNVGTKIEKMGKVLGMKVLLNDPPRERNEKDKSFVSLKDILTNSDIITVHVPLHHVGEDKTYHLINEYSFNLMNRGNWFINTSRGEVTDSLALKKVLKEGKLGGAIIDVWENEPDIDQDIMESSYMATPHIAGYSTDGKANGTAIIVDSICRFFNFPMKNWYPENIPPHEFPDIYIDCKGKSDLDIIRQAVSYTYNIDVEDRKFRSSPSDFEIIRETYPLRREFNAFTVNLKNGNKTIHNTLKGMGFIVN